MLIVNILFIAVFAYLAFFVLYYLVFSLGGKLATPKPVEHYKQPAGHFAVLIPAYKEDGVIIDTVKRNLIQNYPADRFDLVVIADSLQSETLEVLRSYPIRVVEVHFEVSRKAKAIDVALEQLGDDYEYVVILDADNIMNQDYLLKVNEKLQLGAIAIQGHRTAKNSENAIAVLDSVSEEINNHIFRYSQRVFGLSSALIGSGMAFRYKFYKETVKDIQDVWEDRELEFRILKQGVKIDYIQDAYVFDEKVSNKDVFKNQRSKWIAGQIHYLKKYSFSNWGRIFRGNTDLLNKIVQTLSPPRSILIGTLPVFLILSFVIGTAVSYHYWLGLGFVYACTLLIAIPGKMYNRKLFNATLKLPVTILMMFKGLFKSLKSQDISFNTPHNVK